MRSDIDSSVTLGKTLLNHADEQDYTQPTLPEDAAPDVIRCGYKSKAIYAVPAGAVALVS